jgi:DNA-binding transcriptional ArsR family regulator
VGLETTIRLGQGKRGVEDAISYSVGHRTRIEVLAFLNEACRSQDELSKMTHQPLSAIGHHIKALLDDGSIELARTEMVRNTLQHYYRAIRMPFFSDDEIAAMPPEGRQVTAGVILQASMAEAMAAFWAGKMMYDRRVWLSWRWFNVDAQGRNDIADEQANSWKRVVDIEEESTGRLAESDEEATSIIVTSLGFERCRTAPVPPALLGEAD